MKAQWMIMIVDDDDNVEVDGDDNDDADDGGWWGMPGLTNTNVFCCMWCHDRIPDDFGHAARNC